jgi:chromosome segregation and condensation protein ScpB
LELVERFKNLGVCASRASVTAALAVLLVVIGYRQKGGVSKSRVGEILGLDASFYLDELLSQGLIYCDPSREVNFWRPTPSVGLEPGKCSIQAAT